MMPDYGPVPISRLKEEQSNLFVALANGRRVLISRHGQVVAVIEPASAERHTPELAAFALRAPGAPRELSASELNQGSPSEAVREAEAGKATLVTHSGQVRGVLRNYEPQATIDQVVAEERQLADFERNHPDASPEEFAAEVARVTRPHAESSMPEQGMMYGSGAIGDQQLDPLVAPTMTLSAGSAPSELLDEVVATTTDLDRRILSDALLIRGLALEQTDNLAAAAATFHQLVTRFTGEPDDYVATRVARSKVELARLATVNDRPEEALTWTAEVVQALEGTYQDQEEAEATTSSVEMA